MYRPIVGDRPLPPVISAIQFDTNKGKQPEEKKKIPVIKQGQLKKQEQPKQELTTCVMDTQQLKEEMKEPVKEVQKQDSPVKEVKSVEPVQ